MAERLSYWENYKETIKAFKYFLLNDEKLKQERGFTDRPRLTAVWLTRGAVGVPAILIACGIVTQNPNALMWGATLTAVDALATISAATHTYGLYSHSK